MFANDNPIQHALDTTDNLVKHLEPDNYDSAIFPCEDQLSMPTHSEIIGLLFQLLP